MNKLQKAIQNSPMAQKEIAEAIGVTRATLWRYSRGYIVPPPERARALAKVLGLTLEDVYWPDQSK